MSLRYKMDILSALKKAGYPSTRLRNERIIGQATIQRLRHSQSVSYEVLSKLCELLQCQVGDILEYVPADAEPPLTDKNQ